MRNWKLVVGVALVAGSAFAQEPKPQPPQDRPQPERQRLPEGRPDTKGDTGLKPVPQPEDRAAFKARLERMLGDNKRRQEKIESLIKKLDEGVPVEQVRAEADSPRPGGGGPGGPNGQRPRGPRGDGIRGEPRGEGGGGLRGDRPGGPGGPGGPPQGGRMPPEEVLAIIESASPEMGAKFRQGMKDNTQFTTRILERLEPSAREIKMERDPETRQLHIDKLRNDFDMFSASKTFADAFRADPNSEATGQALSKVREVLGVHFDIRTRLHKQEILFLERRIAELREELRMQHGDRAKFIEKRIENLKSAKPRGGGGREEKREKGA